MQSYHLAIAGTQTTPPISRNSKAYTRILDTIRDLVLDQLVIIGKIPLSFLLMSLYHMNFYLSI